VKRWIAGAGIAAAALLTYAVWDAGRNERPPPQANADITMNACKLYGERIKFRSWSATCERAKANNDQSILDIYGVRDGLIYKDKQPVYAVRAEHLSVNTISHDFSATGPVHIASLAKKTKETFDTDQATWNDSSQRLTLPRTTTIHSGASAPLVVGSLIIDVHTGEVDVTDVKGSIKF
jgi:hypothetical protein